MNLIKIIVSILLILHGIYAIYSAIKNKKTVFFQFYSDTYIAEKIFGKYFGRVNNFFWGTTELILGIIAMKIFISD